MIRFARLDCGSKIGLALCIGSWRRAWRLRNPFFMDLTRIHALDLRSLDVIVAEWNARGGLQLAIWSKDAFDESVRRYGW